VQGGQGGVQAPASGQQQLAGAPARNARFAYDWYWQKRWAYRSMALLAGYCMLIVLLQARGLNPFSFEKERVGFHIIAGLLWLVRNYHGLMAACTVRVTKSHVS
jgi:hypothetical protein